jgi:8-oxo-dGTP pyrophosphatase MutT (NUDIX family)
MPKVTHWHELSRRTVFQCRIFDVETSRARSPVDASEHEFFRVLCQDWVQIVPVTPADEVVMVRQYRHGSSSLTLEIPGGLVDDGESPAAAALRECLEETGYAGATAVAMGSVNPNPALHAHRLHAFVATGVRPRAGIADTPTEQTEVVLIPRPELPKFLLDGTIDHALVAVTLWRYLHEYA